MKYILANLGVNIVALLCVAIAGCLAIKGSGSWGWFLLAGLLCAGSYTFNKKSDTAEDDEEDDDE